MEKVYSAKYSILGYYYQLYYPIYYLFKNPELDEDFEINIEKLDDFQITSENINNLFQVKNSETESASLGDSGELLWKTINIWSHNILNNSIDVKDSKFFLITTSQASKKSVCWDLKDYARTDKENSNITQRLLEIAKGNHKKKKEEYNQKKENDKEKKTQGKKSKFQSVYSNFLKLKPEQRKNLVKSIVILDGNPKIEDLEQGIEKHIEMYVNSEYMSDAKIELAGWWKERLLDCLINNNPIKVSEFKDKICEIREKYKFKFSDQCGGLELKPDSKYRDADRLYLKQLDLIQVNQKIKDNAAIDYYRMKEQYSRWSNRFSNIPELKNFKRQILEIWSRNFELECLNVNDPIKTGQYVYSWSQTKTTEYNKLLAENWTGHYFVRGTFHELADDPKLILGWHPNYKELLCDKHE
ncbi:hypothetical protein HNP92_000264 [Methanococcus maripaludis]|uniref:ABC-three component systems C-terminal domain-containing protein n=1 Tax=Methanococcus maripaludis TaxID=39152 RepID=A0A7J9S3C2_METMI|nr:ABC-three component system protein [Methanococcus maripaludis]MBB6400979.1 hypothetical protein [Methanococcus maripaludis]